MKVIAFIPYWGDYALNTEHAIERNTINIAGKSLINMTVDTINKVECIQDVVVYASDDSILSSFDLGAKCGFIARKKYLDSNKTTIEEIIRNFLLDSDADIVVLIHPKSPFLKHDTIQDCVDKVVSLNYDSAFTVNSIKKLAWFKGESINYSLRKNIPVSVDIEPILIETSSVYVFTRDVFENTGSRIGEKPYMKEIGTFEGLEINTKEDFQMAELIVNSGFDRERG
jgi:CMP-N-acetylneuraminic acid synthetase